MNYIALYCIFTFLVSVGYSYPTKIDISSLTQTSTIVLDITSTQALTQVQPQAQTNTSTSLVCHSDFDCPIHTECIQLNDYKGYGTCSCSYYYMSTNGKFCNYKNKDKWNAFLLNFFFLMFIPAGSLYATSGIPNLNYLSTQITFIQLLSSGILGLVSYTIVLSILWILYTNIAYFFGCNDSNPTLSAQSSETKEITSIDQSTDKLVVQTDPNPNTNNTNNTIFPNKICQISYTMIKISTLYWWVVNIVLFALGYFCDEHGYPLV